MILNQKSEFIKTEINQSLNNLKKWTIDKEMPSSSLKRKLLNDIPKTIRMEWFEYFWPNRQTIFYRKKLKQYQSFFEKKFFNEAYVDRGQLFQELSQKGLCQELVVEEAKKLGKLLSAKKKCLGREKINLSKNFCRVISPIKGRGVL